MVAHAPGCEGGVTPGQVQQRLGQLQLAKGLVVEVMEVWLVSGAVLQAGMGAGGVREAGDGGEGGGGGEGSLTEGGGKGRAIVAKGAAVGGLGEETETKKQINRLSL